MGCAHDPGREASETHSVVQRSGFWSEAYVGGRNWVKNGLTVPVDFDGSQNAVGKVM